MKNNSILVQFGLLLIGVSLLFFYVKPAFSEISADQNTLSEYSNAIMEATEVNNLLSNLVSTIENIPEAERKALDVYLPLTLDTISVQRDLKKYVDNSPVLLVSLTEADEGETSSDQFNEETAAGTTGSVSLNGASFNLTVSGSYDDIKDLLASIEKNDYPLHLKTMNMRTADAGSLQAEMVFTTYEFNDDES